MSRTHLIISDQHAHPEFNNNRALWLGQLLCDLKPDVVVNIGDAADMPSLSSYDKGKKAFQGRTYKADINSHLDFQDKLWSATFSRKKKLPFRVFCEGNHEERITRAINIQPELDGAIHFDDLGLRDYYTSIIRYSGNSPGVTEIDGVSYAHHFIAGISGKALSGLHPADALLSKNYTSSTAGHSHLASWSTQVTANGRRIHGCTVGCYIDYHTPWAGMANQLWFRGVMIKRNVEDGNYDPQFISIGALQKAYGHLS